jgi:hypothetical protein
MINVSSKFSFYKIMLVVILLFSSIGCEENETPNDPPNQTHPDFTVFSNQSGTPNESTDALQARYTDPQTGDIVDFYGSYDQAGVPDQVNTVRVQRAGNDTVLNFIIDPSTDNFDKVIFEIDGNRLETMVALDYPSGDTSIVMSYYSVNWSSGASELIYSGEYLISNGTIEELPLFQARYGAVNGNGFLDLLAGIGVGVSVAEVAVQVGLIGGSSLIETAVGTVARGLAVYGFGVVAGSLIVAAALAIMSDAYGAEQETQTVPYPGNTPVNNPTPDPEPSLDPLTNPCENASPSLNLGIDNGNELVAIATGGTGGPYTFSWSDGTVSTENTFHTITVTEQDVYTVAVVDGNGCATSASIQWPVQTGILVCEIWAMATNCTLPPGEPGGEWFPVNWYKDGQLFDNCGSELCSWLYVYAPGTYTVEYRNIYNLSEPGVFCGHYVVGGVEGNLICP